ncbi:hypothetical protein HanIR_Chr01g0023981 [Helianthus annuus]|nr:hypothetical protein HanIR_Chr01g0023981 [Helianthus annuus]
MICPVGNFTLYTLPKLPFPMQYFSSKFSVAFTISSNVNLPSLSHTTKSEGKFPVLLLVFSSSISFDPFRVIIQNIATTFAIKTKPRTGTRTKITNLFSLDFVGVLSMLHGDNPFSDPHRCGFPVKDAGGACLNMRTSGIGPDKLLYERSIDCKLIMNVASDSGIGPEKLLCERLRFSSVLSFDRS